MSEKKSRGRPLGFRLSEESKRAIAAAKTGQRHSEETKEKISRTLMQYFKNLHPLSKELYEDYEELIDTDSDVKLWYESIKEVYDETVNVVTDKSLNSKRMREVSIKYNIDMTDNFTLDFFTFNPEKMCELRMLCKNNDILMSEVVTIIDNITTKNEEERDGEKR